MAWLKIRGACQHNLKNLDLDLPRDRLVVLTGPSGSGKSSLAFDTIYAEGQRRYVESLSAYARQFLEQLAKPAVASIEGLSPAIAIQQRPLAKNPRSTVGTVTEISDYLRLLYARVGTPHCPRCGKRIQAQSAQQIVDRILALDEGARVRILAPVCRARRGELKLELERLRREGFVRARLDGQTVDLGDDIVVPRSKPHDLDVVVDRIVVQSRARARVTDSVELALQLGDGVLLVDGKDRPPILLSERFACIPCEVSLPPIEPRMFSFNGPHGACKACGGLGVRSRIDPQRVVPDGSKTLRQGAIAAWGHRGSLRLASETNRAVEALGVDPDTPWAELPKRQQRDLLYAEPATSAQARGRKRKAREYLGIIVRLERQLDGEAPPPDYSDDDEDAEAEAELGRYAISTRCEQCRGQRLRSESLAVKLADRNIAELGALPLARVRTELTTLLDEGSSICGAERAIMEPLVRAVVSRLGFLIDVGLDYLALDRSAQTLSAGEGQRIRLATQIGSALVGVLYVLDEPSVGLHARDNARLLAALRQLVDLGNTVLVVEHDREAIMAADHVVDLGPRAGLHGGHVVAQGTPSDIVANPESVTGQYLSGERTIETPDKRKRRSRKSIVVRGGREHNLANIDVAFPLGLMVAITGVSGSGKSTLVIDTLLAAARATLYRATAPVGECDRVDGLEAIDKVIAIDQAPIGRTPRSNPATYTGLFGTLRELFAGLPDARARGYKAGRFSFNVKGGRCEACQGEGVRRVELHFLPDVFVTCDECGGKRYNRETLEVQYRGMSIADVLSLTVEEARDQFGPVAKVRDRLDALSRVGLGYLHLGQPATTLSGGEAQRVKLARELAKKATGRTLYVLDEPTTGLHFSDIEMLMLALSSLRDAGNTVLIIEHNVDVIACCDWVIDLGPDGGERGGRVVAEGTPEQVATCADSATGRYLAERLADDGQRGKRRAKRQRPRASQRGATRGKRRSSSPRRSDS